MAHWQEEQAWNSNISPEPRNRELQFYAFRLEDGTISFDEDGKSKLFKSDERGVIGPTEEPALIVDKETTTYCRNEGINLIYMDVETRSGKNEDSYPVAAKYGRKMHEIIGELNERMSSKARDYWTRKTDIDFSGKPISPRDPPDPRPKCPEDVRSGKWVEVKKGKKKGEREFVKTKWVWGHLDDNKLNFNASNIFRIPEMVNKWSIIPQRMMNLPEQGSSQKAFKVNCTWYKKARVPLEYMKHAGEPAGRAKARLCRHYMFVDRTDLYAQDFVFKHFLRNDKEAFSSVEYLSGLYVQDVLNELEKVFPLVTRASKIEKKTRAKVDEQILKDAVRSSDRDYSRTSAKKPANMNVDEKKRFLGDLNGAAHA